MQIRTALLNNIKTTWIHGFLANSIPSGALLELEFSLVPDALHEPLQKIKSETQSHTFLGKNIVDFFDETGQTSLLILGEPGAGKTISIINLARTLIERAEINPNLPIPIILNLSSWAPKTPPIVEWIVEELLIQYQVSRQVNRELVEQEQLLLLLDGLDEIPFDSRVECISALNEFRQGFGLTTMVVSCRTSAYKTLPVRFQVENTIEIQPLSNEQVDKYFRQLGWGLPERQEVQNNDVLRDFSRSPLMLSLIGLAYKDSAVISADNLALSENPLETLFDNYVKAMYQRRYTEDYSLEQITQWLSWLGKKMSLYGYTIFYLDQIQPQWLEMNSNERRFYRYGAGTIGGLLCAFLFSIFGWMIFIFTASANNIWIGITIGGGVGFLCGGLIAMHNLKTVQPLEHLIWSWEHAISWGKQGLRSTLKFCLLGSIIGGLIAGTIINPQVTITSSLMLGIAIGGLGGLIGGLVFGLSNKQSQIRKTPYHSFRLSLKNFLVTGTMLGLLWSVLLSILFAMFFGAKYGLLLGVGSGTIIGLLFGLLFGGNALIRHFILRFLQYRKNYGPLKYITFLNFAANSNYLQQIGGGYIFIHRSLMEYFADRFPSQGNTQ